MKLFYVVVISVLYLADQVSVLAAKYRSIAGPRQGGVGAPRGGIFRGEALSLSLHVNRASDHQMWKVVVVVVGGGTFRLAPGGSLPHVGSLFDSYCCFNRHCCSSSEG